MGKLQKGVSNKQANEMEFFKTVRRFIFRDHLRKDKTGKDVKVQSILILAISSRPGLYLSAYTRGMCL